MMMSTSGLPSLALTCPSSQWRQFLVLRTSTWVRLCTAAWCASCMALDACRARCGHVHCVTAALVPQVFPQACRCTAFSLCVATGRVAAITVAAAFAQDVGERC
eukprot:1833199-Amphidinium_carterae.1